MSYLTQLKTFVEVYRSGNITRAAARLHMSQPAVTSHIQAMENIVGKELFIRKARGVEPTAIADDLALQVASHIDTLEQKVASIRSRASTDHGTLHLAGPAEYLSLVAGPALDHHVRLAPLWEVGQKLLVDGFDHAKHVARVALGQLLVRVELDTLERSPVTSRVAMLAPHAQGKRKLPHVPYEGVLRDVLREVLEVLEGVGDLCVDSGREYNHGCARARSDDETCRARLLDSRPIGVAPVQRRDVPRD